VKINKVVIILIRANASKLTFVSQRCFTISAVYLDVLLDCSAVIFAPDKVQERNLSSIWHSKFRSLIKEFGSSMVVTIVEWP